MHPFWGALILGMAVLSPAPVRVGAVGGWPPYPRARRSTVLNTVLPSCMALGAVQYCPCGAVPVVLTQHACSTDETYGAMGRFVLTQRMVLPDARGHCGPCRHPRPPLPRQTGLPPPKHTKTTKKSGLNPEIFDSSPKISHQSPEIVD
eukprot:629260-Rhodomonas_salina.1